VQEPVIYMFQNGGSLNYWLFLQQGNFVSGGESNFQVEETQIRTAEPDPEVESQIVYEGTPQPRI